MAVVRTQFDWTACNNTTQLDPRWRCGDVAAPTSNSGESERLFVQPKHISCHNRTRNQQNAITRMENSKEHLRKSIRAIFGLK